MTQTGLLGLHDAFARRIGEIRHRSSPGVAGGYIANAAEPWKVPDMSGYEPFPVQFFDTPPAEGEGVMPYARNDDLARPWIKPGTPGLEHRIGGIEKDALTGNISYAPENHEKQTKTRQAKVDRVAQDIGELDLRGETSGDVLVIGWGGTYGSCLSATRLARKQGKSVAHAHVRYLNPFPKNLGELMGRYKKVSVELSYDADGPEQATLLELTQRRVEHLLSETALDRRVAVDVG